jgi:hypothetical protein
MQFTFSLNAVVELVSKEQQNQSYWPHVRRRVKCVPVLNYDVMKTYREVEVDLALGGGD